MPDGQRLDSILGSGFTLLSATRLSAVERQSVGSRGATAIEAPPGSELGQWLRRSNSEAVIVRPDFTVMRAGRVAELCQALPTIRVGS